MATSSSSTSSSSRLGNASPSTSVICQEVFDESCQPSEEGKSQQIKQSPKEIIF